METLIIPNNTLKVCRLARKYRFKIDLKNMLQLTQVINEDGVGELEKRFKMKREYLDEEKRRGR